MSWYVPLIFPPAFCLKYTCISKVVWTGLTRKSAENAWVAKVPTWPLTFVFVGQIAAVAGGVYWVVKKGECSARPSKREPTTRGLTSISLQPGSSCIRSILRPPPPPPPPLCAPLWEVLGRSSTPTSYLCLHLTGTRTRWSRDPPHSDVRLPSISERMRGTERWC